MLEKCKFSFLHILGQLILIDHESLKLLYEKLVSEVKSFFLLLYDLPKKKTEKKNI